MNDIRAAWEAIPSLIKTLGALCTGFAAALVAVGATLNIPGRLTATEILTARHSAEIMELRTENAAVLRRLDASDLRAEYLICLVEHTVGEGRRTPAQCASDYARGTP